MEGRAYVFPKNDVGLRDILSTLKAFHEEYPHQQPSYEPAQLLVDTVQGSSTLREEIYFKSGDW